MKNDPLGQWANSLGISFSLWLKEKENPSIATLAEGLEIHRSTLLRIARAESIANDTSFYARIFVRTGLTEADPRTLPNRIQKGKIKKIAWSEETYDEWYQNLGWKFQLTDELPRITMLRKAKVQDQNPARRDPLPVNQEPEHQAQAPPDMGILDEVLGIFVRRASVFAVRTVVEPTVNQVVEAIDKRILEGIQTMLNDAFVTGIASAVRGQIDQHYREENQKIHEEIGRFEDLIISALERLNEVPIKPPTRVIKSRHSPLDTSPGVVMQHLIQSLEPALTGTAQDRDRVVQDYGHDFGRLFPLVQAFMQPSEKREETLMLSGLIKE